MIQDTELRIKHSQVFLLFQCLTLDYMTNQWLIAMMRGSVLLVFSMCGNVGNKDPLKTVYQTHRVVSA